VKDFIEEVYTPYHTAVMVSLYVPRGAIKKGDSVLIVDDVIDSGETQRALIKIVEKSRGDVIGIYALVAVGDEWKKLSQSVRFPVELILQVSKKSGSEEATES
jgi:adenine/guanine phosphoribosyltransferase-like PRPP-binding protein